jgi:hypothetical protein
LRYGTGGDRQTSRLLSNSPDIEPLDAGRVRVVQQEVYRGLLVPLMARSLDRHTLPAFKQMNQALKRRAEELQALNLSAP